MGWNWDHLRFFLALARTGTLAAAGEREGVSHTTVFRRVRRFEEELQTKLFDRTSEGWSLTREGSAMLLEAERMEHSMQTIARDVGGRDARIAGPVSVAVGEAVALTLLPAVLRRLQRRHPALQLDLQVGRALVDVEQREADLAVRFSESPPERLLGRRLGRSGLVACASPDYVESHGLGYPMVAEGHRFVVVKGRRLPGWAELRLDAHPEVLWSVDDFVTATALCRAGLGITEAPDFVVDADPGLVRLQGAPARPPLPAWLLVHPDLREIGRVRVTADALYDGLRGALSDG
ncbi:MAG: LysR family transcriptional regulator [Myxococcota bacterium]